MAPAEMSNFLVRESAKQILEIVAPGECRFVRTAHFKTKVPTPWFLAVPQRQEITATPPKSRERCPKCNEPWSFAPYEEATDVQFWQSPTAAHEVFKSKNWASHKGAFTSWEQGRPPVSSRKLYVSIRLDTLLKKLKMRGMIRSYSCKDLPTPEDMACVNQQLEKLKANPPSGGKADKPAASSTWFADYLTKHTKTKTKPFDFAALEKREGVKLPASYKDFAVRVGQKKYKNFNDDEGHDLVILPPAKLDFDTLKNPSVEEDSGAPKRGVIFGAANSGDSLYFDVSKKSADPEVLHHDHETDEFEPFAKNFAECIKQLADS